MGSELFSGGLDHSRPYVAWERVNPMASAEQLKTGPTYIQLEGYKEQLGGSWGWVWVAAGAWFDPANLGGAELEQPWSMSL